MDRRHFLAAAGAAAAGALVAPGSLHGSASPAVHTARRHARFDLVLRNAEVYDGSGAPGRLLDVAIRGDRIAAVAADLDAGTEDIDLRGLALAPGFVDIHSHTDLSLFVDADAHSKIRQGVTTEVTGADGGSVAPASDEDADRTAARYRDRHGDPVRLRTLGDFFTALERHGIAVNVASMVGAGTIRGVVIGDADRPATPAELARMRALVRAALADGACGLSSGLEYVPGAFADTDELAVLAGELRGTGLPYASHMRNEDDQLLAAIEEALFIGRLAGVPVQISHLKAQGERNWYKAGPALELIEAARADGIDVHFDRYPYIAYSTTLANLFPVTARDGGTSAFLARLRDAGQRTELERAVRGKIDELGSWDAVQITSTGSDAFAWARGGRLGALAAQRGVDPWDLLVEIMLDDENRTGMVGFGMSEENTARILAHPLGMVCSDAGARATSGPLSSGVPHPRAYGSFPRMLGHYVRDQRIMPLETAIAKMSGMPAAKLRLADRGRIAPGACADIVVFDPATVADTATFEAPHSYPRGIPHVLVNGNWAVRDGEHTGARSGRVVRPER